MPDGSPRYEDPQTTDRAVAGWVALGEIKGYAGSGGKTADLMKMERFVAHYVHEHGSYPSARWYLANHFRETDPDRRPEPLAGATNDVAAFAEEAGWCGRLTLAQLFRLWVVGGSRAGNTPTTELRLSTRRSAAALMSPEAPAMQ